MDLSKAFDDFQANVSADQEAVTEARRRRDTFRRALEGEDDVDECFTSGSLARSTQIEPINDVDMVATFDAAAHPDWGAGGESAKGSLEVLQQRISARLGSAGSGEVRRADIRNHAVKCFLDDPDDPDAFTVDVAPALAWSGTIVRLPEVASSSWIETDPRHLISLVAARQAAWPHFRPLVRCLKRWAKDCPTEIKSLTMEVLALEHLLLADRPQALGEFFVSAAARIYEPVEDPAGLCGPIQPNLDTSVAHDCLNGAADLADQARAAQAAGETDRAGCLWHRIFGDCFPEPPGGCKEDSGAGFYIGAGTGAGVAAGQRKIKDSPGG
jgi:hypothetical protein